MRIDDITEASIFNEADKDTLDMLVQAFRNTTGTFNNASHKFYSVRKTLANSATEEQKEVLKTVTPSEFFKYNRESKVRNTPQSTPKPEEKSTEPTQEVGELRQPTQQELDDAGTVYALIGKWTRMYHEKYSVNEITDVLYQSPLGDYEEKPYIRNEVSSYIIKMNQAKRDEIYNELYPQMQKRFKLSKNDIEELKGGDWYNDTMKEIQHDIYNQPKTPGQAPLKPAKAVGFSREHVSNQFNTKAFNAFKDKQFDVVKELLAKRDIAKYAKNREILNWMVDNK